jgi:CBS domain-containing protein
VNLAELFAEHAVTSLDVGRFVRVGVQSAVRDAVAAMNDADVTCACICDGSLPVGMLTDRDVLTRVVGYPMTWDMPVEAVMTPGPETVAADASVADALELMNVFRFRNVPIVDGDGALVGNLDRYALLQFAAKQVFSDASIETHELAAQHGLLFIDFAGLNLPSPIAVAADTDLKRVVHTMRGRGIGSVLVTGEHGAMVGIFTDHDAQMKVACRIDNLGATNVGSVMTPDPLTLDVHQPIADGLRLMADKALSHIPLTGATDSAVAIVSFRDVADYLETTFISMA